MLKRILKWTGGIILFGLTGLALVTASRQDLKFDAPYPSIKAVSDSSVIARGRHLAQGPAHCAECHSRTNADSLLLLGIDVPLSGGKDFNLPVGTIYSKNLTPDRETGIGRYSDAQLARALRYGVHPDGTAVYDFMPFHQVSDEDLTAIFSYLRAQPPVHNQVPENRLNLLGYLVKAFLVKPVGPKGPVPGRIEADSSARYGEYLAISLAQCNGCHTRRDVDGSFLASPCTGGDPMEEKGVSYLPPDLTQTKGSRLYGWTDQDFIRRFRMGKVIPGSPMPWNYYNRMSDMELKAIFHFLKSLPPSGEQHSGAAGSQTAKR